MYPRHVNENLKINFRVYHYLLFFLFFYLEIQYDLLMFSTFMDLQSISGSGSLSTYFTRIGDSSDVFGLYVSFNNRSCSSFATGITDITVVNFLLGSFYHFISESYHGANLLLNILHAFLYWLRPSGIMVSCNVIEIFLIQGFKVTV